MAMFHQVSGLPIASGGDPVNEQYTEALVLDCVIVRQWTAEKLGHVVGGALIQSMTPGMA
jgi:hypothetical protein